MKTKVFFLVLVVISLMSIRLSAQVQSFTLQAGTNNVVFNVCETVYDSVVVYKVEGDGICDFYKAGVGTLTQDSVIITPATQGEWEYMANPSGFINFTVNFVSTLPTEPFVTEELYKCSGESIEIFGQETPQPDFTYLWGNGETTPSINLVTPGMVYVTVTGACGEVTDYTEVINWMLPEPDFGEDILTCDGATVILDPGTFTGYLWSDDSDGITLEVTTTGTYGVTVTDDNGCQGSDDVTVTFTSNPGQEIFLVTIDTINGNNKVTWEVVEDAYLEVRIYREASTDVYEQVGTTTYSSGSWTDEVSSVAHEWKYKIMLLDTCNNLSELSDFHQTISTATVPIAGGGYRVEWTPYIVEGSKSVANYYIFTVQGLGMYWNAEPLDTVTGTVYAYNLPIVDDSMFVVGAELEGSKSGVSGLALSNLVNNPLLAVPSILAEDLKIYPNPSTGVFFVEEGERVEIYNTVGQLIMSQVIQETKKIEIPTSGIYTIKVYTREQVYSQKIIIQ